MQFLVAHVASQLKSASAALTRTTHPVFDSSVPSRVLWNRYGQPVDTLAEAGEPDKKHLDPDLREAAQRAFATLLRHQVPCKNLQKILDDGELVAGARSKNSRFKYNEDPNQHLGHVFTELTNDDTEKNRPGNWADCTIFLSIGALNGREGIHLSWQWWFGQKRGALSGERAVPGEMTRVAAILPQGDKDHTLGPNEVVVPQGLPLVGQFRGLERK